MDRLTDKLLFETYLHALQIECDPRFIDQLLAELKRRNIAISTPQSTTTLTPHQTKE